MREIEEVRAYYSKILPYFEREIAARKDIPFWEGLARRWKPRRILEIGCGTGRVTRALSKSAPAVGIDVSFDLLRRARAGAGAKGRTSFLAADFRSAVFARRFDLIVAPSDPICHLSRPGHRRRALTAVARQLLPGGRFVLDALVRRESGPVSFERVLRDRRGQLRIREDWEPAGERNLWRGTYTYEVPGRRRGQAPTRATFLARAWDPATIAALFSSCGLEVETVWGSYSRGPWSPSSRRLLVVARPASR
ncbi:MAG TPA: class I SAM-dependent methyltransferase [Thermoanaerobaculia bacterium]|nr:class I SAM-dependent methyltransferase [Thermoanaerobaculia bacterium]